MIQLSISCYTLHTNLQSALIHYTRIYAAVEEFPSREHVLFFVIYLRHLTKSSLIFKLKNCAISGSLFVLIESYLSNRKRRVVLNGECSEWSSITAGVPQGCVLCPLFFLVYISDLVDDLSSDAKLFVNDTSLFTIVYDENVAAEQLNNYLKIISECTSVENAV